MCDRAFRTIQPARCQCAARAKQYIGLKTFQKPGQPDPIPQYPMHETARRKYWRQNLDGGSGRESIGELGRQDGDNPILSGPVTGDIPEQVAQISLPTPLQGRQRLNDDYFQ